MTCSFRRACLFVIGKHGGLELVNSQFNRVNLADQFMFCGVNAIPVQMKPEFHYFNLLQNLPI